MRANALASDYERVAAKTIKRRQMRHKLGSSWGGGNDSRVAREDDVCIVAV
jgi:hypothetical protein